ncbi:MAG: double zinc ribbon domain-containing protein [Paraclostridium sp.]|uniref:double zinc ribbon domain-containing protein n=1 Tax=Paraclostridium sp. TaxID=2023273 RepID=UPI003EE772E0
MYCKNCGNELKENASICVDCGVSIGKGNKFCKFCGNEVNENSKFCISCGNELNKPYIPKIKEYANRKIYCRNCANEMDYESSVCTKCGVKRGGGNSYCYVCGKETDEKADICVHCGVELKKRFSVGNAKGTKSKLMAVILCILFGTMGIHRFYVGDNTEGFILLALTLGGIVTCGITTIISGIWVIVDLIFIIIDKITDENGEPLQW